MNSWLQQRTFGKGERKTRRPERQGRRLARRAFFEQLEDRSLMAGVTSPPLDMTIEAINSDQNSFNVGGAQFRPPDPHGAAGPNHVVNVINSSVQWFTKEGVQQTNTSLKNFFSALSPANETFDPKAIYDQQAGRFVVLTLELLDFATDGYNASRILLAVSDDADPNGTWHYQSINMALNINGGPQWIDYPGLAIDEEAIYVTGNMIPFSNSAATADGGSRLVILPKAGLYSGGQSTVSIYNPTGTNSNTASGLRLQPAQMFGLGPSSASGATQVGTWLVAYNGNSLGSNELLTVVRVDNPLNNPVFNIQSINVGDIDDTLNSAYPNTVPGVSGRLPDAPQLGSVTGIDTVRRSIFNAVWRDNSLYAVTSVIPPSGADVNQVTAHWFRISTFNPAQLTVADQGNVGGEEISSNVFTFVPSVAVDKFGNMAVGFAASGPAMYAGAYYALRAATDAPGTTRPAKPLAVGQDTYIAVGGGRNRWGDYTGIALDPSNESTFWVYNQYALPRDPQGTATFSGRYGTRWGSFFYVAPPTPPTTPAPPAYVSGVKWNDLDKDGVRDTNEVGVGGFTMYVDVNGNNRIDVGEPAANTNAIGEYLIESTYFGTYAIREAELAGWIQTYPGTTAGNEHTVTLVSGQTVSGVNFGNFGQVFDFGDAPAPYPTTLAANGARAGYRAGFHLGLPTLNLTSSQTPGVETDTEADGVPSDNADSDDLNGTDDEDGVQFPASGLVAGGTATLQITVANGGAPVGVVQGWIDFNGDGDWTDAGEQVIKDTPLTEGVHNIAINVPATATSGITYARFRYGYERGIGTTGTALVGEVEDYAVQVISDQPVAGDDAQQVDQNSSNNLVNVLSNDFASSSGGLRIQSVGTPNRGGTAAVDNRGTTNPADDVILYTPVRGFIGTETFTYVITDNSGKTDTATVTMTVVSLSSSPIAVDDSFTFAQATATQLDVIANDVVGDKPPITIASVAQPSAGQGTVSIIGGGTLLQYSPPSTTFSGDVQFSYTIQDTSTPTRRTSTATVTLHVGNTTADDQIAIFLRTYDLNGNQISVINPGQEFELRASVQDLRTDDTVGNPTDNLGVYAAYFDTLYENSLVSLSGPVVFDSVWTSGQSGGTNTQGLIDESGAFQGGSAFFSTDEVPLFSVRMRANAVGQADFASDPADNRPLHDSLVFQPPSAVAINQITYGTTSLFIGDPAAVLFKAIDDSVTINANSGNVFIGSTTMQVMNNDLQGLNTPVVITNVTPIGTFAGNLQRTNNNTTIQYSAPAAGFVGVQQFSYTLTNALGATSTAVVTMNVGSSSVNNADDLANIRLEATNNTGSPITSVTVGNTFQIRAFVSDLRSDDGDGNAATDNRGLYAAYLDVLYSYQNAEFVSIEFNTVDYNNGKKGDGQIPGIVDEIGAFQTSSSALGAGEVRLFTINMRAKAAGTFTYQGNPRDVTPLNDVTLFSPPTNLTVAQVRLNSGTVTISGSGAGGEAEFTNPSNAMDVNGDGFVTPLDVLLVINDMNNNGSRALVTGAGGEAGSSRVYLDVNRDLHVTPIDALLVVNYLNEDPSGEGEAAADPLSVALDSLAPENSTAVAGIAAASDASASNSTSNSVVAVVASNGAKQLVVEDDSDSDDDASLERLLDELAGDVAEGWAIS